MKFSRPLFCTLDGLTPHQREEQRQTVLQESGWLQRQPSPLLMELTENMVRFLRSPIAVVSVRVGQQIWFKAALGFSRLELAQNWQTLQYLPPHQTFCSHVIDAGQALTVENSHRDPYFCHHYLTQTYGIQSYLGVPLTTEQGYCIGAIAVMDLQPREFTPQDQALLTMAARWCWSEWQLTEGKKVTHLQTLGQTRGPSAIAPHASPPVSPSVIHNATTGLKLTLLEELIQELRTPLTAIIGMASVLQQGIYGSLNDKQTHYLDVIHESGQKLVMLVSEIIHLRVSDLQSPQDKSPVDVEMLGQQVTNNLAEIAQQNHHKLHLSLEPGDRIWLLPKQLLHQSLYYLLVSVLEAAAKDSDIQLHISLQHQQLRFSVWVSHPWQGTGLNPMDLFSPALLTPGPGIRDSKSPRPSPALARLMNGKPQTLQSSKLLEQWQKEPHGSDLHGQSTREMLALVLSCHLAEVMGGKITLQKSPETGYRYALHVPLEPYP